MENTNYDYIYIKTSNLFLNIKANLKLLKNEYSKIIKNQPDDKREQILYDNYCIIEKI